MIRTLHPEWLDTADSSDPRARRSRRDLERVNLIMGNATALARSLRHAIQPGARIADLGGGDGRFMLRVASRLGMAAEVTLVDRAAAVSTETLRRFERLGWKATSNAADVTRWLQRAPRFDAIAANLFLHHFDDAALRRLLALASERTRLFVACEPRRSRFALAGSRALRLVGCSRETLHDAAVSVHAGFEGSELTQAWPQGSEWTLEERPSGFFSHLFIARRREYF
jgi:2-polyprenyl-3-methyl-5-hydroxy-6-metoxy-1,4-benzoquinol methylase